MKKRLLSIIGLSGILVLSSCSSTPVELTNEAGETFVVEETDDSAKIKEVVVALSKKKPEAKTSFSSKVTVSAELSYDTKIDDSNYSKAYGKISSETYISMEELAEPVEDITFSDLVSAFKIYSKNGISLDYETKYNTGSNPIDDDNSFNTKFNLFNDDKNLYFDYQGLPQYQETQKLGTDGKYYFSFEKLGLLLPEIKFEDIFNSSYIDNFQQMIDSNEFDAFCEENSLKITSASNNEIEFSITSDISETLKSVLESLPAELAPVKESYENVVAEVKTKINVETLEVVGLSLDASNALNNFLKQSYYPNQVTVKDTKLVLNLNVTNNEKLPSLPDTTEYSDFLKVMLG